VQFDDCDNLDDSCFAISNALKNTFLSHREQVMEDYLNGGPCCEAPSGGIIFPSEPFPDPQPHDPQHPIDPVLESALDLDALVQAEAVERRRGSAMADS